MERHSHSWECSKYGQCSEDPYHELGDCDDADADFEGGEGYAELYYEQDYPALVKYSEAEVARRPGHWYARYDLGKAYVLNGQYQEAIDLMMECHREHPDSFDIQHVILDALIALGKTEDDVAWVEVPSVMRLDAAVIDNSYEYLRRKRKPRTVSELCSVLAYPGYLAFSHEELIAALAIDDRFDLDTGGSADNPQIKVRRKGRRTSGGRYQTP